MGLIKALTSSTSSTLGDQFKEFITCPNVDKNVLIVRGSVQHGEGNKNPSDGVITNGSKIVIPQGWAMMLVDNGKVVEFSSEPGDYVYDSSSEPSIFYGGLGKGIIDSIKTLGSRITYGGQTAKDQRVYYVNLLTVMGNKFGSAQPKKITDEKYGIIEITFFGEYAYRVEDPVALVGNVLGANAKDVVTFDEVMGSQLKMEFVEQISKAISEVMRDKKVSFGDMQSYGSEISDKMNEILSSSWKAKYGLIVTDVAMGDINVTEDSMERINRIDDATIFSDAKLQSGLMATASAEALKDAANNDNGAMLGFAGMNMAGTAGAGLMGVVNQNNQAQNNSTTSGVTEGGNGQVPNFCPNCGTKTNGANFCSNCGAKLK
ncbi:MAG TPA: SPFH domain-containing protein [Candidatus Coprovivens excrementavium]|nr:SPFH domain-containing protein [Candidatus Coprovivens excrementavium]